jgi:hypothetical protein
MLFQEKLAKRMLTQIKSMCNQSNPSLMGEIKEVCQIVNSIVKMIMALVQALE